MRQDITHLGQEINGKPDLLGAEVHDLTYQVEEAESRVEVVERWPTETTEALSSTKLFILIMITLLRWSRNAKNTMGSKKL